MTVSLSLKEKRIVNDLSKVFWLKIGCGFLNLGLGIFLMVGSFKNSGSSMNIFKTTPSTKFYQEIVELDTYQKVAVTEQERLLIDQYQKTLKGIGELYKNYNDVGSKITIFFITLCFVLSMWSFIDANTVKQCLDLIKKYAQAN